MTGTVMLMAAVSRRSCRRRFDGFCVEAIVSGAMMLGAAVR